MNEEFERWWKGSKYCQVVYGSPERKQIALDGWNAANNHCEYRAELMNIAHAKMKDFDDAESFREWARSRARFTLGE